MNYIKRLEKETELFKKEVEELRDGFQRIRIYLNSSKFSIDTYVNRNDILLRIEEILNGAFKMKS